MRRVLVTVTVASGGVNKGTGGGEVANCNLCDDDGVTYCTVWMYPLQYWQNHTPSTGHHRTYELSSTLSCPVHLDENKLG